MKKIKIKNNMKPFQGAYRISVFRALPDSLRWLPRSIQIRLHKSGLTGGLLRPAQHVENLIVHNTNHGIHLILLQLGGSTAYPLEIDNASIGTGATAASDADTDLQTPVLEDIVRATVDINLADVVTEWFITNDELANGTYTEFGLFCGTQLFARSIISPSHTKGNNEDTLIEYTINAANTL